VDQRGGIQRVAVLAGQLPPRHGVQFLVQRGEHAVQRGAVAAAGGIQPQGDVGVLSVIAASPGDPSHGWAGGIYPGAAMACPRGGSALAVPAPPLARWPMHGLLQRRPQRGQGSPPRP
jgi:hypothetical protein